MKKRKVNLKKLSLQKKTIASINADSVKGGAGTILETNIAAICNTAINTGGVPTTIVTTLPVLKTMDPVDWRCKITNVTCPTECVKCF